MYARVFHMRKYRRADFVHAYPHTNTYPYKHSDLIQIRELLRLFPSKSHAFNIAGENHRYGFVSSLVKIIHLLSEVMRNSVCSVTMIIHGTSPAPRWKERLDQPRYSDNSVFRFCLCSNISSFFFSSSSVQSQCPTVLIRPFSAALPIFLWRQYTLHKQITLANNNISTVSCSTV